MSLLLVCACTLNVASALLHHFFISVPMQPLCVAGHTNFKLIENILPSPMLYAEVSIETGHQEQIR